MSTESKSPLAAGASSSSSSGPGPRPDRGARRAAVRWIKRGVLALVALALAVAAVVAMLPKPVPVDLAEATGGPMRETVSEDGKTRVRDRYTVSAPITGNLLRLTLQPGDPVETGAVLARIVPMVPPLLDARTRAEAAARLAAAQASHRQAQAQVARARTALEHARREAERQRALAAKNAVPAVTVDQAAFEERARAEELTAAEFGTRVAAQQVASARAAQGMLRGETQTNGDGPQLAIKAPVSGHVLRVLREDEGLVQAGTPLLELGDPASLEVVVDVLTTDAVHIRPGAPVSIVRWGVGMGDEQALAAHVQRVEPSAFTRVSALGVEEQRVNVLIDIDAPRERWAALGDGFRVEAEITTWEAPDVLSVPASAVFRSGDDWAVFALRDGTARLVPVTIGHRNGARMQILTGLDAGDQVVLHPGDRVTEGADIEQR